MKKKILFPVLYFSVIALNCFSQNRNIDSLLPLLKKDAADTSKVIHLYKLTREFELIGDFQKGLNFGSASIELATALDFKNGIAQASNNVGNIYLSQADYPKAIEYYLKALKLYEELKDTKGIALCLGNIGLVYFNEGDSQIALEYYFKALRLDEELNNKKGIIIHLDNIGVVFYKQNDFVRAFEYYFKALKMSEELKNKNYMAAILDDIGNVYDTKKNYPKALDNFLKSLKISIEIGNKTAISKNLRNIGSTYISLKKYTEAYTFIYQALAINDSIGLRGEMNKDYNSLSELYEKSTSPLPDTIGGRLLTMEQMRLRSLYYYKRANAIKEELFSQAKNKETTRKEMNYEFDKKEAFTKAEHDKEMAVASAEKKKQQQTIWLAAAVLLLVAVFAFFVSRSLRITRKQKNIIVQQKEIVDKQNEKIIDSITYAQRIQQSILMEESEIQKYFPDLYIYYKPKDIVSGDFYWCAEINDQIILAAVDCTGHGVSGAFMSMIGNTLLNQIVNEKYHTKPSEILRLLNLGVYEALHQKKDGTLSDDGMDIALCCIDYKNNRLQYAGQNPLYILSDGKIEVIKGDIYGIGGGSMIAKIHDPLQKIFTNHVIPIKEGMSIYLSTDGYMDQFGGTDRKKFGTQKFKELLLNNQHLSMQRQKELIESAHEEWKGNTPQIDDILIIGVKV